MYKNFIKRLLDILFSLILIIILFPIMIVVGILSKIYTGNVIYKQPRDGKFKKSFTMYKFKTMLDIEGDYKTRTPVVMRKVRCLGLDELPQLFNILKGDMSFIGPRPFITGEVLPKYPDPITYEVSPGLISLAVSNGRRNITHNERLKYDIKYVQEISFKLDITIVFKTIYILLKQNLRGELWTKY